MLLASCSLVVSCTSFGVVAPKAGDFSISSSAPIGLAGAPALGPGEENVWVLKKYVLGSKEWTCTFPISPLIKFCFVGQESSLYALDCSAFPAWTFTNEGLEQCQVIDFPQVSYVLSYVVGLVFISELYQLFPLFFFPVSRWAVCFWNFGALAWLFVRKMSQCLLSICSNSGSCLGVMRYWWMASQVMSYNVRFSVLPCQFWANVSQRHQWW